MASRERAVERLYRKVGSRILVLCQGVHFLIGFGSSYLCVLGFLRFVQADAATTLWVSAAWCGECAVVAAIAGGGVVRAARPLKVWLDGPRTTSGAEEAWRTGIRLPFAAARWTFLTAAPTTPLNLYLLNRAHSFGSNVGVFVAIGLVALIGSGLIAAATMLITPIAVRPMLLDIRATLGEQTPEPPSGLSVRVRLLAITPALFFIPLIAGAAATLRPNSAPGQTLVELAVGAAISAAVGIPFAFLLAAATLRPLEDLLVATERLRSGDLTVRVPALAGDEHGELARTFNEAIVGLAEREVLAGQNAELLDEVRASRARIVAASDAERTRIERNLHDGAQQRLVALALDLRVIWEQAATDDQLRDDVERAQTGLKAAVDELRELARGVHPSVLTTDGLRPAVRALADRSTTPVVIDIADGRLPSPIESTIYFVVSEAIANVDKHAGANRVDIGIQVDSHRVLVTIADDGRGGADPTRGTGLTGLADRVAAVGGRLAIDSPPGQGTRLCAEVPAGSPAQG
jgi:signal transduction histidine kinase